MALAAIGRYFAALFVGRTHASGAECPVIAKATGSRPCQLCEDRLRNKSHPALAVYGRPLSPFSNIHRLALQLQNS